MLIFLVGIDNLHHGLQFLVFWISNNLADQAGKIVSDFIHTDTQNNISESYPTRFLSQNEGTERIPLGKFLPGFHLITIF